MIDTKRRIPCGCKNDDFHAPNTEGCLMTRAVMALERIVMLMTPDSMPKEEFIIQMPLALKEAKAVIEAAYGGNDAKS
jgi:hypothetical protein